MTLSPAQFRVLMLLGGSAVTVIAILISHLYPVPFVAGLAVGILGMALDKAIPSGIGGQSGSSLALVIVGAVLGYFVFSAPSPDVVRPPIWPFMLQYVGPLYAAWGAWLFMFPVQEDAL